MSSGNFQVSAVPNTGLVTPASPMTVPAGADHLIDSQRKVPYIALGVCPEGAALLQKTQDLIDESFKMCPPMTMEVAAADTIRASDCGMAPLNSLPWSPMIHDSRIVNNNTTGNLQLDAISEYAPAIPEELLVKAPFAAYPIESQSQALTVKEPSGQTVDIDHESANPIVLASQTLMTNQEIGGLEVNSKSKELIIATIDLMIKQLTILRDRIAGNQKIDPTHFTLILSLIEKLRRCIEKVKENSQIDLTADKNRDYSLFPIEDELFWAAYCIQEAQLWTAKEINLTADRDEFERRLKPRYKELVSDILGFFLPGDGLVSKGLIRFILEAETFQETMFFVVQLFNELTHAEAYGMAGVAFFPDKTKYNELIRFVDTHPSTKAKADFMEENVYSDKSAAERYFASACGEGIFFVVGFVVIFYLRTKGVLKTFIQLNDLIAADESHHRDVNADVAKRKMKRGDYEKFTAILDKAIAAEEIYLRYVLREPVESVEDDEASGLTIEKVLDYAKMQGDQILTRMGLPIHYGVKASLSWMTDMGAPTRNNMHELQHMAYKRFAVADALNWRRRVGLEREKPQSAVVDDPNATDF